MNMVKDMNIKNKFTKFKNTIIDFYKSNLLIILKVLVGLIVAIIFMLLILFLYRRINSNNKYKLVCTGSSTDTSFNIDIKHKNTAYFNDDKEITYVNITSTYNFDNEHKYNVWKKAYQDSDKSTLNNYNFTPNIIYNDKDLTISLILEIDFDSLEDKTLDNNFPNTYDEFIAYYEETNMKCK